MDLADRQRQAGNLPARLTPLMFCRIQSSWKRFLQAKNALVTWPKGVPSHFHWNLVPVAPGPDFVLEPAVR